MRISQRSRLTALALCLLGQAGCGEDPLPAGSFVVHVTTDAPVPLPPGSPPSPQSAPPLFDRVRVDLYLPDAALPCASCSRELAIDRGMLQAHRASFGVVPNPGVAGYRIRLRMFDGSRTMAAEPPADAAVELWIALPPAPEEGQAALTALLPSDAVAAPIGSADAPASPASGAPSVVGAWPGAQPIGCADPAQEGEVCVPGGAFWMGNPLAEGSLVTGIDQQRLVVISPFYLDATEVSVAAMRASGVATAGDPRRWSGQAGFEGADFCNYTGAPGDFDALPVNCVTWHRAREYCQRRAQGGDLPTEAQFEYAAGGRHGWLYVWGQDEPGCDDAVFLRAGDVPGVYSPCLTEPYAIGRPLSTSRPDHGRDGLVVPGGAVYDLAGNVAEWTLDVYRPQGGSCWGAGLFHDPICQPADAPAAAERSVRGGSWQSPPSVLRAAARVAKGHPAQRLYEFGFRCARPAQPDVSF
jgi:formylglycine-generating enzyme required for sulfatase activity